MPANKHKRKITKHAKKSDKAEQVVKGTGMLSTYPVAFIVLGLCLLISGIYFLLTGMQNNAMFGIAMLLIISGTATAVFANLALPKNKKKPV